MANAATERRESDVYLLWSVIVDDKYNKLVAEAHLDPARFHDQKMLEALQFAHTMDLDCVTLKVCELATQGKIFSSDNANEAKAVEAYRRVVELVPPAHFIGLASQATTLPYYKRLATWVLTAYVYLCVAVKAPADDVARIARDGSACARSVPPNTVDTTLSMFLQMRAQQLDAGQPPAVAGGGGAPRAAGGAAYFDQARTTGRGRGRGGPGTLFD